MIKTILVPATGSDADAACFVTALSVARSFAAHIDALHVRLDPIEIAVSMSTEGSGGALLEGIIADLTRDADELENKARSAFAAFCAREALMLGATPAGAEARPSAEWHVETGQEARWMTAYGMTADLIVSGRGVPGDDAVARSTLEAMLLETGRPLLVPGPSAFPPAPIKRVVVAWKPTPQAARAVSFAMPFLSSAAEVTVMTVEEEADRRDDADRVVNYFAWHGVKAVAARLPPGPHGAAETLLAAAAKADLLVMGGYGHTRLREWVFGGFTQRVLADAPLSVLMAH